MKEVARQKPGWGVEIKVKSHGQAHQVNCSSLVKQENFSQRAMGGFLNLTGFQRVPRGFNLCLDKAEKCCNSSIIQLRNVQIMLFVFKIFIM